MSVPPATESQTERLIISELVGRFASASNATFLGEDPEGVLWVYKPVAGARHLWDFPPDSLANREIMAYEVSTWMGLDLVPETVEASGPAGPGAAQRYLDPDPDFDYRKWFEDQLDPRLWPVAVFDLVANNADRKLGHVLVESDTGRLFAIDHGLTFHAHQKLRTVLWAFAGEPIPDPLVEAVSRLRDSLEGELALRAAELLTPPETDALCRRAEILLADPRHPHPPVDRSALPWPLW